MSLEVIGLTPDELKESPILRLDFDNDLVKLHEVLPSPRGGAIC